VWTAEEGRGVGEDQVAPGTLYRDRDNVRIIL